MSGPRQIPMDLPLPAARSGADFLTSPSNQASRDAVERWREWPDQRLVLTGPEGSGKSHLAQIWAEQVNAASAQATELTEARMAQLIAAPAIVVEDIDLVARLPGPVRRQVETVLFHLYNLAAAENVPLLFTGRTRPAHWQLEIPDLASRTLAMAHVRIAEPDDALLTAILEKLFHDRQMQVGPDVLEYLLRRIERSFAAAERIVARLDQAALATKRGITRPLAVEVLAEDAGDS